MRAYRHIRALSHADLRVRLGTFHLRAIGTSVGPHRRPLCGTRRRRIQVGARGNVRRSPPQPRPQPGDGEGARSRRKRSASGAPTGWPSDRARNDAIWSRPTRTGARRRCRTSPGDPGAGALSMFGSWGVAVVAEEVLAVPVADLGCPVSSYGDSTK